MYWVYTTTNKDDITTDSRTAREGSIFVASVGYTVDSHKFCQNVADEGVSW